MSDPRSNKGNPRVLHMVWNLMRGGTEGQCARVVMGCSERGLSHRVAVFSREGYFLDAVEESCGPVFEVRIRRMMARQTWRECRRLHEFVLREHIDLVHAWDADASIFGSWVARRARIPYITSRRDLGQIYAGRKLWMMNRADKRASAIVVNARAILASMGKQRGGGVHVCAIPNILDLAEFDGFAVSRFSRVHDLPKGRLIGMVCRLDPEKDVATMIRAMHLLSEQHPDVRAVIAGNGPERNKLQALIESLHAGSYITLLGEVENIPALLRHFEIGVLVPNCNEGLSNSILEYMAARLPVVATDCGGSAELVSREKTGYLVKPGDEEDLARYLGILLVDRDLAEAMGAEGRRRVEKNHAPAAILDMFMRLYKETVSRSGS